MELKFSPSFFRDLKQVKDRKLIHTLAAKIRHLKSAKNIQEIDSLKKMDDYKVHYRIKIKIDSKNDFRLGITIRGNTIWVSRFLHRNKIYKEFP